MSPAGVGITVLCLLAWAGADRLYIHPFHMLVYSPSSCEQLEQPGGGARPPDPTFTAVPIQAKTAPVDEEALREPPLLAAQALRGEDKARVATVGLLLNFLGLRLYRTLLSGALPSGMPSGMLPSGTPPSGTPPVLAGGRAVFSPTALFGTLTSFYLGARDPTAGRLQAFLGVPGEGQGCTSRLDGHKVLGALQAVQGLLLRQSPRLRLTTVLGLFTAPGLRLKQPFVAGLAPFAPAILPRSLDLAAEPRLAAEKIRRFMQAVTGWDVGGPRRAVSPDSNLLVDVHVRFHGEARAWGGGWG